MDSILGSRSLEGLSNAFAAAVRRFGITAFAIGQMPTSGDLGRLHVVRWPAWIEYYAVNGFAYQDIAIVEMSRSLEPFTWTEAKTRYPGEGARVFEACSGFGWNDGLIVPIDGPDARRGFVSLASPSSALSLESIGRAELTALSMAAYSKTRALADDRRASLRLSGREQEALAHVANGRNDAEIGVLMAISTSTAHAHVERAKSRLGASTRAQAVALALTAQII